MRNIGTDISNWGLAATMVVLFMGMLTANLDTTILSTAIPKITEEFNSLTDMGWYGSSAFLTFAAFQTTWGKVFKYFNLKWSYALTIVIFELGSIICAVAKNSTTLIVGRAVAGIGAAGLTTGTFVIIGYTVIEELRPAFMGVLGATYALASFIGPIVGGAFTEKLTWRWCFWINVPIGGLALGLLIPFFRNPKHAKPLEASWKEKLLQLDPVGSTLILAMVACFSLAMQWGGLTKSWSNSEVIGTLVGSVLLAIATAVNEAWMGEKASIVPRLIKIRRILVNQFVVFLNSSGQFILVYYIPIYFQSLRSDNALQSAVHNLPFLIGGLFSMASGALLTATNQWLPFLAPGAALSAVGGGLIYTMDINTPTAKWVGYQLLAGATTGFVSQIPIMANTAIVDLQDMGSTSAMTLLFQLLAGSFSVSAAQSVFSNLLLKHVAKTAPDIPSTRILATGASDLRRAFNAEELPLILDGYTEALKGTFAMATAMMAASVIAVLCLKWEKLHPEVTRIKEEPSTEMLPVDPQSPAVRSSTAEGSDGGHTWTTVEGSDKPARDNSVLDTHA
ncbi:Fc.00g073510.m01.CDS01 [Cosmosporella sp. VM-42]